MHIIEKPVTGFLLYYKIVYSKKISIMMHFNIEKFSKSRIETFSDGVFAIIVTLLVLDIKIPPMHAETDMEMMNSIGLAFPKIFAWVCSFLITCVIWMNHHRIMDMIKHTDAGIFWLNNLLLMCTSLIPFPTSLLGEHPGLAPSCALYGICLMSTALCFVFIRLYILKHRQILKEDVDISSFKAATWRTLIFGSGFYLFAAFISLVSITVSLVMFFIIPLYFILPRRPLPKVNLQEKE